MIKDISDDFMGHKASIDTGIFYSGKTAKGCIHGPFFRRVPLAGFELAVSRHVRFTMWRTRNLVASGAGQRQLYRTLKRVIYDEGTTNL